MHRSKKRNETHFFPLDSSFPLPPLLPLSRTSLSLSFASKKKRDASGKVVAVNYAGDESAAREVPIDYVTAALDKLKKGKAYRGDAGVVGMLVPLGEATRNFRLPADAAAAAA